MITGDRVVLIGSAPNHHSYFRVLMRVFRGKHITLIISPELEAELASDIRERGNAETILRGSKEKLFTPAVRDSIEHAGIVVLDEPFTFARLAEAAFRRMPAAPHLTVHNVNSWFFPRYSLSPKQNLGAMLRTRIIEKTRSVIVVGSSVRDYLAGRGVRQNILYVPFDFPSRIPENVPRSAFERLRVAVPGTVSARRDYDAMLDSFRTERSRGRAELVLLGAPSGEYGARILRRCADMRSEGYAIRWFERFLSTDGFEREIARTDILLSAFDISYRTIDGQIEIYGMTKETGISFLAYTHALPVILPAAYHPPAEIASQVIPCHDTRDLAEIIGRLAENPAALEPYRERARTNTRSALLEPIRSQFQIKE
jgi:hypothetical protein